MSSVALLQALRVAVVSLTPRNQVARDATERPEQKLTEGQLVGQPLQATFTDGGTRSPELRQQGAERDIHSPEQANTVVRRPSPNPHPLLCRNKLYPRNAVYCLRNVMLTYKPCRLFRVFCC